MEKDVLFGKTLLELQVVVKQFGFPSFTAKQIAEWLYKKNCTSIEQMSNLSVKNRDILSEKFEVGKSEPILNRVSEDGTQKFVFKTEQSNLIESVFIPDIERGRATLCVSSQSGCRMGCKFCATGALGFKQNLSSGQILNQIASLPHKDQLTNFVFMGMGEPLDNIEELLKVIEIMCADWGYGYSPRRITISSVGILPALLEVIEKTECHIAISLHSPYPHERILWMPAENKTSITEVVNVLSQFDWAHQRHLSFEYIVFESKNDSLVHAKALIKLLRGLDCKVNLIPYHTVEGLGFNPTSETNMKVFRDFISSKGVFCTLRQSRGMDIQAACGQLAANLA